MPDMWAHLICGQLASQSLEHDRWQRTLLDESVAFNLGCQAPDFFYYHNFRPWHSGETVNMVSVAIHWERCGDFAVDLITGLNSEAQSRESNVAFVMGFLCHWVLDRVTHPYIHYKAGIPNALEPITLRSINRHKYFELIIDTLMAKKHLGLDPCIEDIRRYANFTPELPSNIITLLDDTISRMYLTVHSIQDSDYIEQGYRDMISSFNWSYDPHLRKQRYFWRILDRIIGLQSWSLFHPVDIDESVDYLNEARRDWSHPVCDLETHDDSFHDLFSRAVSESRRVMDAAFSFTEGSLTEKELRQVLGDDSYRTGKDWRLGVKLLYDDPVVLRRPY